MKAYNLILCLLIASIFAITFVSAGAELNKDYNLKISCNGFDCSNLNVTITYPNSTILIDNEAMTDNGYYADYTLNPSINGRYDYYYSDGTNSSEGYFITTSTGNELNSSQMTLYLFIGIILILLFVLFVYGGINIPFSNERNSNSEVIAVNWKKYLNIFCWALSYMLLLAIVFVSWNLIYAYAQWDNLAIFFHYLYKLLYILALPVLATMLIISLVNYFNDKQITSYIKKMGLPYNG